MKSITQVSIVYMVAALLFAQPAMHGISLNSMSHYFQGTTEAIRPYATVGNCLKAALGLLVVGAVTYIFCTKKKNGNDALHVSVNKKILEGDSQPTSSAEDNDGEKEREKELQPKNGSLSHSLKSEIRIYISNLYDCRMQYLFNTKVCLQHWGKYKEMLKNYEMVHNKFEIFVRTFLSFCVKCPYKNGSLEAAVWAISSNEGNELKNAYQELLEVLGENK